MSVKDIQFGIGSTMLVLYRYVEKCPRASEDLDVKIFSMAFDIIEQLQNHLARIRGAYGDVSDRLSGEVRRQVDQRIEEMAQLDHGIGAILVLLNDPPKYRALHAQIKANHAG